MSARAAPIEMLNFKKFVTDFRKGWWCTVCAGWRWLWVVDFDQTSCALAWKSITKEKKNGIFPLLYKRLYVTRVWFGCRRQRRPRRRRQQRRHRYRLCSATRNVKCENRWLCIYSLLNWCARRIYITNGIKSTEHTFHEVHEVNCDTVQSARVLWPRSNGEHKNAREKKSVAVNSNDAVFICVPICLGENEIERNAI